MIRGIPLVWLQEAKDQEAFKTTLRNSTLVLGRLQQIIEDRISAVIESETSVDFYDEGALAKMAFNRGQLKALQDQLQLLSFLN